MVQTTTLKNSWKSIVFPWKCYLIVRVLDEYLQRLINGVKHIPFDEKMMKKLTWVSLSFLVWRHNAKLLTVYSTPTAEHFNIHEHCGQASRNAACRCNEETQPIFELGTLTPRDLNIKLKFNLTFLLNRNTARAIFKTSGYAIKRA